MGLTKGQIYYYGGMIVAVICVILLITAICVFEVRKKKVLKELDK